MKKRNYVKPILSGEEFIPQVYCKNCSADDNKEWVYNFTCDAGNKSSTHTVYLETNNQPGLQNDGLFGWGDDQLKSTSYHPCGATHTVTVQEKLSETNLNSIFPKGYIKINGKWEECRVWTANGTNTHCTTALNISDFQLAKS